MTIDHTDAGRLLFSGVPEGLEPRIIADLARGREREDDHPRPVLHVARDDRRLEAVAGGLKFFAPDLTVIPLPAWDCVPYDRISPNAEIVARRISALARLAAGKRTGALVVLTTVNGMLQRVPPRSFIRSTIKHLAPDQRLDMQDLIRLLEHAGYRRTGTVMEHGEYAVRGGILDLFPPGRTNPVRLDFFGDTLESIKPFDAGTQRTAKPVNRLTLLPVSELATGEAVIKNFRRRYVELFGAVTADDPLYEQVSQGSRPQGAEHWLPLFHDKLETVLDYLPDATLSLDHLAEDAVARRIEQVLDHYQARADSLETSSFGAPPYKPVPPDQLYLLEADWTAVLRRHPVRRFTPFAATEGLAEDGRAITEGNVAMGGRVGRNFTPERLSETGQVFDAVVGHVRALLGAGKRVLVASWTNGARERLGSLLADHGLEEIERFEGWPEVLKAARSTVGFVVMELEQGFETDDLAVLAEQDILGDRLVRSRRRTRSASEVLSEASSLSAGDLVVHVDHGIARFAGLKTIEALGAPHDCLELHYQGGDKLYLPVENIELLSRYGSDAEGVTLDKLGGAAWQSRKARMKQRLKAIADELIKIAAMRQLRQAPVLARPEGLYDEFVARFPFEETEDQEASIEAVLADLQSGRPMDRLVCGDVGFGKTEVALRAAFVAVMNSKQVAVVVPTTLLSRQHYKTFSERFAGLPVRVAQASRMVTAKDLAEVKEGLKNGAVEVVVGTHALLAKSIEFKDLGLLIVDEEQHFGVAHKERLKQLREDVHVLTLTATPIPRTLQLALSGVRELSLITTAPIDRLAVRTFVSPFDPMLLREALMRERYRGGQSFYVCPRISDLGEVAEMLAGLVPELKVARAHGQMSPTQLEDVMSAFYDGQFDILLSTSIVESGLDIPRANTLVVHRADMFGLAQLYQLRGRVGRSKTRAYAYLTVPADFRVTEGAEKRLKVLQSLDTLGAGFSLASHDLDLRGAGNLLGEEQSGHIKEVGFELYQSMLEEAIAALKDGHEEAEEQWSPQISIGTAVLIPEPYVSDLALRLGLYRRIATLESRAQIDDMAAELVDRFGPLPPEVRDLLEIVEIKALCRRANVAVVEAGPKGVVFTFRKGVFANPDGLIAWVQESDGLAKILPDQKVVYKGEWETADRRLKNTRALVRKLAEIAAAPRPDKPVTVRLAPPPPRPPAKPKLPKRAFVIERKAPGRR